MSKWKQQHIDYFDSEPGLELLTTIAGLLDSNHRKAENEPELAQDYMQRAKGVRDVEDVISSLKI